MLQQVRQLFDNPKFSKGRSLDAVVTATKLPTDVAKIVLESLGAEQYVTRKGQIFYRM